MQRVKKILMREVFPAIALNDINVHVVRFHNDIGLAMFMGN